ncbi:MAG: sigma-54 dependent transcriptional regulator [Rikenellaceae bacterium]
MTKILIIDDERYIRNSLKEALSYESYSVSTSENCNEALELMTKTNFDLIVSDVKMEGMDGIEFLCHISNNEMYQHIPVIIITGHGNVEIAVRALKNGAFDFIEKPIDLGAFLSSVKNALDKKENVKEAKKTIRRKKIKETVCPIIGESEGIKNVKRLIQKVAPSEARVLITGSNGTGKELIAREIHRTSHRCNEVFIEVNCAAIPSELIESEMFGHEKGSFTSADKLRKGKFELANEGTLFLDEIGDLPLAAQAKLLRVLQEKKICRVGGDKDINVNVRVIAATNKNLREETRLGHFREDLYHRLSVIIIHVPDLNQRRKDIPILIDYFLEKAAMSENISKCKITEGALNMLSELDWSGNIRELLNVIERLVVFTKEPDISETIINEKDIEEYVIKYLH